MRHHSATVTKLRGGGYEQLAREYMARMNQAATELHSIRQQLGRAGGGAAAPVCPAPSQQQPSAPARPTWACATCTFANTAMEAPACEMCGSERKG